MRNPFQEQAEYHRREAIKWSKRKTAAGVLFVIVVIWCFLCP
jgi:hypothetical protein